VAFTSGGQIKQPKERQEKTEKIKESRVCRLPFPFQLNGKPEDALHHSQSHFFESSFACQLELGRPRAKAGFVCLFSKTKARERLKPDLFSNVFKPAKKTEPEV
jgi:hypothetical protein